jgi:flagellar biosynthesis protein
VEEKIQKAVALRYNKEKDKAPKVVAKGKGEIAQKIIQIAKENELPIKKDEDLVELLTKIDLDREIPPNLYKAVAEVFSFIYNITNKK